MVAAAKTYLELTDGSNETVLTELLGNGEDGIVWRTSANAAIKAFYRRKNYEKELACYIRLCRWNDVTELSGFSIPKLIGEDDHLMVIEMGIVTPPWVLDFGKAYIDRPADYPEGVLEDSFNCFREHYTSEDWERVMDLISDLRSFGIYYYDLKPGNVKIGTEC